MGWVIFRAQYWLARALLSAGLLALPRGRYRDEVLSAVHDVRDRCVREVADSRRLGLTSSDELLIAALVEHADRSERPELLRTAAGALRTYGVGFGRLFDLLVAARNSKDDEALQEAIDVVADAGVREANF